mmetsp:Transcript_1880/g.4202  ORF Transcript_1880/g.4202 Transcript_1880/m.4202 type:complete len:335 (+) Transcript_1880:2009-3013(+)
MDSAAHVEFLHMRQLHRLVDDTLPRKGGIAVEDDRHHASTCLHRVAQIVLLCACAAQCDRVHRLQVRRVRLERHSDRLPTWKLPGVRGSEVVLHVASKEPVVLVTLCHNAFEVVVRALKLGKHLHQWLGDHIGEDVEPATVRHPDDAFLHAHRRRLLDGRIDARNSRLSTIHPKALRGLVLLSEELLEGIDDGQLLIGVHELSLVLGNEAGALDAASDPIQLLKVADVHVLDPNRAAVRGLQRPDDILQCGTAAKATKRDRKGLVHVGIGEAMVCGLKLWNLARGPRLEAAPLAPHVQAQGAEVRHLVAPHLVGPNEILQAAGTTAAGHKGATC